MYPLQQSFTPLEYFSALVQADEGFPLFEVAACLAQDEHPELNLAEMFNEMDHLVRRLELQIPKTVESLRKVQILNRFFYRECGFAPNLNHYHDSDNCYLSAVIRNRRGNSITLALIWMELAQAIGIKCALVCFNKDILIKVYLPNGQAMLEPNTGFSYSRAELDNMMNMGAGALPEDIKRREMMFAYYSNDLSARSIVEKLALLLSQTYEMSQDWAKVLLVMNRMVVLQPDKIDYYRERGWVYARLGDTSRAEQDFEIFLAESEEGPEYEAILKCLQDLRA